MRHPPRQVLSAGLVLGVAVGLSVIAATSLKGMAAIVGAAILLPIAWRRPELPLTAAGLLIPSGMIYPPFRIHISTGFVTLFQLTVVTVAVVTLFKPNATREGVRHPVFKLGVVVLVAGLIAVIGAPSPAGALYAAVTFSLTIMCLSVALAQRVRQDPAAAHRTLIYLGVPVAALAIYQSLFNRGFLASFYSQIVGFIPPGPGYRPTSTIGNALVASSVFVGMFALALVSPHLRRLRVPALAVFGVAIGVSASRSSIALLAAVILLYVLVGGSGRSAQFRRRRIWFTVVSVPLAFLTVGPVTDRLSSRLNGRGFFQDNVRSFNAGAALDLWRDSWASGLGFGGYRRIAEARNLGFAATVDNQYVSLLVEVGAVGVILLLLALMLFRRRSGADGERSWLPLVAMMGTGLAFEFLYHDASILLTGVFALDALSARTKLVKHRPLGVAVDRELASI